jgi:acetyl esterase/lipase
LDIHPELRFKGNLIKLLSPPLGERGAKAMHKLTCLMRGKHGKDLNYEQVFLPRGDGTSLRVCVYTPLAPKPNAPALVWMHGGGFSVGVPEQDESAYIKRFIDWGAGVVASPDYTKSVVKPYPAAIDDCYQALAWLYENMANYKANPSQLFIGGDSAGGGLAAALSLLARDRGQIPIAFQMPLYPMIDDRPTKSNIGNTAPVWNSKSNILAWKLYLGDLHGKPDVPCYAAPARAKDFSRLPKTFTFVGDIEPFYAETADYAESLRKCGTLVEFKVFKGCFHAFDMVCPKASVSREAACLLEAAFKSAVSGCRAG